jgi:hypothetical protein
VTQKRKEGSAKKRKGQTPITPFRLGPAALADLDFLARAYGLKSRAEVVRLLARQAAFQVQLKAKGENVNQTGKQEPKPKLSRRDMFRRQGLEAGRRWATHVAPEDALAALEDWYDRIHSGDLERFFEEDGVTAPLKAFEDEEQFGSRQDFARHCEDIWEHRIGATRMQRENADYRLGFAVGALGYDD